MAEQAKARYDVLFLCTDNVTAMRYRRNRIAAFASLPATTLDRSSLSVRMNEIGQGEGAITPATVRRDGDGRRCLSQSRMRPVT